MTEWELDITENDAEVDWQHPETPTPRYWTWEIAEGDESVLYGQAIDQDELAIVHQIVAEHNEVEALRTWWATWGTEVQVGTALREMLTGIVEAWCRWANLRDRDETDEPEGKLAWRALEDLLESAASRILLSPQEQSDE